MMKYTLIIVMLALVGVKLISAAALNLDPIETPDAMKGLSENLKSWLREISAQIKESAKSVEDREVFERFFQKENYEGNDAPTVIIEEEETLSKAENELSLVEDEPITNDVSEDDESGVYCHWNGYYGTCCASVRIYTIKPRICFIVQIHLARGLGITFQINGHKIWHYILNNHHNYRVCLHYRKISICNRFTNINVSLHYARVCVRFEIEFHHLKYQKFLGCISKRYEIGEEKKKASIRKQVLAQLFEDQNEKFFSNPQENKPNNQILRFF